MLPFSIMSVQLLFHPALNSTVGEILEKIERVQSRQKKEYGKKVGDGKESVKMLSSKSNIWLFLWTNYFHTKRPLIITHQVNKQSTQGSKYLGRNLKTDVRAIRQEQTTDTGKVLPKQYPLLSLPGTDYRSRRTAVVRQYDVSCVYMFFNLKKGLPQGITVE